MLVNYKEYMDQKFSFPWTYPPTSMPLWLISTVKEADEAVMVWTEVGYSGLTQMYLNAELWHPHTNEFVRFAYNKVFTKVLEFMEESMIC